MVKMRDMYKHLSGKPTGKRKLWKTGRRLQDYVQMDLKEYGVDSDGPK
jgi:hypothetical protein